MGDNGKRANQWFETAAENARLPSRLAFFATAQRQRVERVEKSQMARVARKTASVFAF